MAILNLIKRRQSLLVLLTTLTVTIFLFYPSLNFYFFQDDWFVLNRLETPDIIDFLLLREDVIYWRPLGMQGFFFLSKAIFNLNPIPYHIIIFSIHLLNGILIYDFLRKVIKIPKQASLTSTLIYLTGSFHFMSLSWLSLSWVTLGVFFFLMSMKFFFKEHNITNLSFAYILFLLALASTEFTIIYVPFLLILLTVVKKEKIIKSTIFYLVIVLLSIILYGIFRLAYSNFQTEYQIVLGEETIKNIFWYFLWFFNFPQQLKEQIILTKLQFTDVIIRDAGKLLYFVIILPLMSISIFIYLIIWKRLNIRYYLLLVLFFAFLLPVLFLKNHSYPYYLSIASIPLVIFIGKMISRIMQDKLTLSLFVLLWLTSSFVSSLFNYKLHWASKEQQVAKEAIITTTNTYRAFPIRSEILLIGQNSMLEQSLLSNEAFQVIYENKDLTTNYNINMTQDRFVYPVFLDEAL